MVQAGQTHLPNYSLERAIAVECGVSLVAGADEAGRGALAGPVFAAAVQLPPPTVLNQETFNQLQGVRDSKLLSPEARNRYAALIRDHAFSWTVAYSSAEFIDQFGILSATRHAMTEAVGQLVPPAQAVLVDGPLRLVNLNLPQWPVVRGDRQSLTIAAASILAKVSRDRYMIDLGEQYPDYGFARHKGYGTAEHLAALGRLGPCPEHRRSFAPLRVTFL